MTFFPHHATSQKNAGNTYRDPAKDWFRLLIAFFTALIGLFGWSVWMFDSAAKEDALGSSSGAASLPISKESFEEIHAIFERRANEVRKNEMGAYGYTDPSQ